MHLAEALRSTWHDVVTDDISVVAGRDAANIDSTLEEAVVNVRVASIDQNVVVVAQWLRAVKI